MYKQIPTPRDNITLDYSRWQQNLIGVLNFDIEYHTNTDMGMNLKYLFYVHLREDTCIHLYKYGKISNEMYKIKYILYYDKQHIF